MEQAKKHDRKIMITDIAIDKVPLVEVPGLTRDECEMIACEHKHLLRTAKDSNNSDEVSIIIKL
ncbi:hypothetical protein AXF19_08955 [Selenomonas sp. oral taxon 126]|uniref:hypothetical protein n=1 Tax=Selenomonas sp. oral taxon 126 TaxID=712528 RepID=UPI000807A0B0|nr:hypothetical protein [Selenomonas sp. oral taxon 126]ANR71096.1 hypothetical protein AXF19_08955 [Selenomonas sp. oral taxon 126]